MLTTIGTEPSLDPLLAVRDLTKTYAAGGVPVRAVSGVSFSVDKGEALGIVGESGSGKTTVARCVVNLTSPTSGQVVLNGADMTRVAPSVRRASGLGVQYVFQDPYDSLDPRWRVRRILAEPLHLDGSLDRKGRDARVAELLRQVNLDETFLDRMPRELSGGQRQRIGIARALAARPALLILDEPTSALDSLTRRDILQLLLRLKAELGTSYLFISHDLSAVHHVCDRIAVMYLGEIVELAPASTLFRNPRHPYTKSLMSAVLTTKVGESRKRIRLKGEPPSPLDIPAGCRLHRRCPEAIPACSTTMQHLEEIAPEHAVRCMVADPRRGEPSRSSA
jgi:oligopeptide/dipeptide ABC transporter ATP-binding protein